jgi:hypothetical protein
MAMLLTSGPFGLGIGELLILLPFFFFFSFVFVIPAWVICDKLGWPPPLSLLALLPWIGYLFVIALSWEALPRAGATRWLMLLLLFPLLGLVMLFWLAFSEWKAPVTPVAA